MELPQPRPFGTEGRKPTQDFLSLYALPAEQDPRPSAVSSGYLKTHDFLQPLERGEKKSAKEEINTVEIPPILPAAAAPTSVEHILPGGIGTYSISHISCFNQRVPKPEGAAVFTVARGSSTDRNEETSNCSSYTGSAGFTLWEESAVEKGKTGKENVVVVKESAAKVAQWTSERPSQPPTAHRNSFSSLSSSRPLGQKNQSFIDIIKAAKSSHDEEEYDEDEFLLKKAHKGELTVKIEGKNIDQKVNTPRSKHSATEQRRRSKINDRFQMLRELIPHSDQKRDKASFLLEVIEYIQFLQEKVQNYDGSYQGWNHEPKVLPGKKGHKPPESHVAQTQGINGISSPALLFPSKIDENDTGGVSSTIPLSAQNPIKSDMGTETTFREMDPHPGLSNKTLPTALQPTIYHPVHDNGAIAQAPSRPASRADEASQPHSQLWQSRSCTTNCTLASDKLKEQEMTINGGTISISSMYSQGLLNTLTDALQSSGVDLSQASISVQIELGKRPNGRLTAPSSILKDTEVPSCDRAMARSRASSCGEDSGQSQKRLKLSKKT